MKSQVLHTMWCNSAGETAGEIWNWSFWEWKGPYVSRADCLSWGLSGKYCFLLLRRLMQEDELRREEIGEGGDQGSLGSPSGFERSWRKIGIGIGIGIGGHCGGVFEVTSIDQRSSSWTCNSVNFSMKFYLELKLHFPLAQLRSREMEVSRLCIEFLGYVLTFNKREYELSKLHVVQYR